MSAYLPSSRSPGSTRSNAPARGFTCTYTTPYFPQFVAMSSLGFTLKSARQVPSELWLGPSIALLGDSPGGRDRSERTWPKVDHGSYAIRAKNSVVVR